MPDRTDTAEDCGVPLSDPVLRARIADFLTETAHALDDDRLEEWPDFFTERGTYRITTRENEEAGMPVGIMHCAGRGMILDRIRALRTANIFEPHTYCHVLGPSQLSGLPDGLIRARTNFLVIRTMQNGESSLFAAGRYRDAIVMEDDAPRLDARTVILESRRVDVLLVIPI